YKNRENWVWNLQTGQPVFRQPNTGMHMRAVFWRGGVLVPELGSGLVWQSLGDPSAKQNHPTSEQLMWLMPAADQEHVVAFTRWFKEVCRLGGEPLTELGRPPLPRGVDRGEFASV